MYLVPKRPRSYLILLAGLLSIFSLARVVADPAPDFIFGTTGSHTWQSYGDGNLGNGLLSSGYASEFGLGSTTPAGVAIIGFRQNNVLVSETGIPAVQPIKSGRIYAEVGGTVDTG